MVSTLMRDGCGFRSPLVDPGTVGLSVPDYLSHIFYWAIMEEVEGVIYGFVQTRYLIYEELHAVFWNEHGDMILHPRGDLV